MGLCPDQPSIKHQTQQCSPAAGQDYWQGKFDSGHPRGLGAPHPALDSWPCSSRLTGRDRPGKTDRILPRRQLWTTELRALMSLTKTSGERCRQKNFPQ